MKRQLTIEERIELVYQLEIDELCSSTHRQEVVDARTALIYYLYTYYRLTQRKIAERLGINQSNVQRALKRHKNLIEVDAEYKGRFRILKWVSHQKNG